MFEAAKIIFFRMNAGASSSVHPKKIRLTPASHRVGGELFLLCSRTLGKELIRRFGALLQLDNHYRVYILG